MKLRYHQATISFCPDLLNPDQAGAVFVGVLLLGETANMAVALLTVTKELALPDTLPTVVKELAADFPRLVQAQLEQILKSDANTSIDTIMEVFEDSLRNSFYVSDLLMNQEVEIDPPPPRRGIDVNWLYEPTTRLANATVVRSFEKPWWMDVRYRPWLLANAAGVGNGAAHV
jgi:hypothetical protein